MKSSRVYAAIMVILLVSALVVSGCSGKEADKSAQQPAKGADDVIVIGHSAPLSGSSAAWGQQEEQAIKLTQDLINEAGGVLGKKIKVITLDDRGDKVEVVNVVRRLITQDKAVAIVAENMSSLSRAVAPVVEEAKVPTVSTMAIHPAVTVPEPGKVRKYYFRVSFIAATEGGSLADAVAKRGFKKASIIYDVGQDYSMSLTEAFKKRFTQVGGQIVAEETIKEGDEDFRAVLTRIKDKPADIIILPIFYKEGALIIKQARELGIKTPFAGGGGLESDVFTQIGGSAVEGTLIVTHFAPDDPSPVVQQFREKFKAKYKVEPDANAATAHDALVLIADAIKRAGKVDREAIRDALESAKNVEGVTGQITIDPATHNPKVDAFVLEVKGGKLVFLERIKQ